MKIKFCEQYQLLRILSLKAELAEMPNVKIGKQRGKTVVRDYHCNSKGKLFYRTYPAESSEGQKYCRIANRRSEVINEIKSLEAVLGRQLAGMMEHCRISLSRGILSEELWNAAKNDQNPREKNGSYFHNGIQMRSRIEVLIAEILDELGLEYKYEPAIRFGDEVFYPDFLVYIPCLKRCMIIEFFGMIDNEKYAFNAAGKMAVYANSGLIMNRDVIGLFGTKDAVVSDDIIYDYIVMIVNLLATEAVVLE